MKKYEFYLGTISIVLCLLPIVLLRDTTIIHEHLTEISAALGTLLMGTGCLVFICEVDARCLSIKIRKSGIMLQKDFYTVPLICVILVVELVIYYLVDLTFVKERFEEFSGALGSIVVAYLVYGFFMENYQLMKTTEIEEPSKRKK